MTGQRMVFIGRHAVYERLKPVFTAIGTDHTPLDHKDLPRGLRGVSLAVWDSEGTRGEGERARILSALSRSGTPFAVYSAKKQLDSIQEARRDGARDCLFEDFNTREMALRIQAILQSKRRIVCIGGGTGLFNLLSGLKALPKTLLTSIVTMADDGGSSGTLRTDLGILPPGDVRRSLVALSNAPQLMNRVLNYRFDKGRGLKGHSFGNLFLAALSSMEGSMTEAVRKLGDILNLQGVVLPITQKPARLGAIFEDGSKVLGESRIDLCKGRSSDLRISKLFLVPEPEATAEALAAILFADVVIIGPGDLYTSVIANLLVGGVREAFHTTNAKRIYICNLMTKPGETTGFDVNDHVHEVIKYLNGDALDVVLASSARVGPKARQAYARKRQAVVGYGRIRRIGRSTRAKVVLRDLVSGSDLVRHDPVKLLAAARDLLKQKGA